MARLTPDDDDDIDLDAKTLSVVNNRVDAGRTGVENDPKSVTSQRTLPLTEPLVTVLRSAKARQGRRPGASHC